jgi:membrane protease YdiL (CAAX protease family)
MTNSKKDFSRIGLALVAACVAIMVFSRLVFAPLLTSVDLNKLAETIGPSAVLLMTDIPNILFLLVFWLFVRRIPKSEWQRESMSFKSLFQIFVMMYAAATAMNLIGMTISKAAPAGGSEQLDMIEKMVSSGLPAGILMVVLIGPVVEELIFRKLMLDRIRNYGEKTAIVFSALCFGLFHGNLAQFLYAFMVGLFLGYVYCRTGKVVITMVLHGLMNLISCSIILLAPMMTMTNITGALTMLVMGLTIMVLLVLGLVQLIRHLRRKDLRTDNSMLTAIPAGEIVKTVYLNPCVMLFVLFCSAEIVLDLMKISF